jgi:hypothetical protein
MRILVMAIGTTLTGAALSACSFSIGTGTPTVAKADLQNDITDRMKKAGEEPQSVTCMDDLEGVVGKTTRCEVVLSATNAFEPIVTVTKVDGATVSYDMTPAMSQEQLQKQVSDLVMQNSGDQVDGVKCESGLEGKVDNEAHCQVQTGGETMPTTVKVTKVDGLMMNFTVNRD